MLGSEATFKEKGIQTKDSAGGRHVESASSEEYGWCPVMEEEPTEDILQLMSRLHVEP